jgi:hypothetical protein
LWLPLPSALRPKRAAVRAAWKGCSRSGLAQA